MKNQTPSAVSRAWCTQWDRLLARLPQVYSGRQMIVSDERALRVFAMTILIIWKARTAPGVENLHKIASIITCIVSTKSDNWPHVIDYGENGW
jgi:hypothetical protein